jgi:hypothetical protein
VFSFGEGGEGRRIVKAVKVVKAGEGNLCGEDGDVSGGW